MNLRYLVRPLIFGGTGGVAVALVGFAVAAQFSVLLYIPAVVFTIVGTTLVGLLFGASSFNENADTPDPGTSGDDLLTAPTEAGPERRLTVACFGVTLALTALVVGVNLG